MLFLARNDTINHGIFTILYIKETKRGDAVLKNKLHKSVLFLVAFLIAFCGMSFTYAKAAAALPSYCENTPEGNASLIIGGQSNGIAFVEEEGSLYLDVESGRYSAEDTEFLLSVVYYDYSDSEESFSLEYHKKDGSLATAEFQNTGRTEGWAVSTVGLNDIDLTKKYTSDGFTLRIVKNGDVLLGKVEFINLSAQKKNGAVNTTCLGNKKILSLHKMNVPSKNASTFDGAVLGNQCTKYDMMLMYNLCTGQPDASIPVDYKKEYVTQGELAEKFLEIFEISPGNDALTSATDAGLIETVDYFLYESAPATYYNLACLSYNCIAYDPTPLDGSNELPVFKTMLESKILDGLGYEGVCALENEAMHDTFVYGVKKYPYTVMTDGMHGEKNTFGFVSYFGSTLYRPYFSIQQFSRDGKSFICTVQMVENGVGKNTHFLYSYNTETQTFRYIDTINNANGCVMGDDDNVYYVRRVRDGHGQFDIYRSPLDGSKEPEFVYRFRDVMWLSMIHLTNDCRYLSMETNMEPGIKMYDYPAGTKPIVRVDLENKNDDVYTYYGFNYSNNLNHIQINPVYEDLIFFAHETVDTEGYFYTDIHNRANIVNVETGEVNSVNPGLMENSNSALLFFTHENWSYNGKYLYMTNLKGYDEYGPLNGIVRVDKDGTHRRFFDNRALRGTGEGGWGVGGVHTYPSGDDRYFALDGSWVSLMSAETNQVYPICETPESWRGHPYHAHPTIARHKYVMNWGMTDENGVLGISWFDFSHLDKTKLATGGRYKFGDCVENVRYSESRYYAPALPCDVSEMTFMDGRKALYAKSGKNIYFDINEDIVDGVNESVKITFDYYGTSANPIVLTYTKGAENANDLCRHENMTKEIPSSASYSWKTAEVIIESGNFEDIGTYGTDFYINGGKETYVSNVKVERISDGSCTDIHFSGVAETDSGFTFEGSLTRSVNTVTKAKVFAALYDNDGKLLGIKGEMADFKEDSIADFSVTVPCNTEEASVRFFVWADEKLSPQGEKIELASFDLTATSAANGVKLEWNAVEDADSYEIYRDGTRIAVTDDNVYNDKYFTVPELLDNDIMEEYTTPHRYVIKCKNKVSRSVNAAADPTLIKYVINPTDTVIDFGDTEAAEYVAVVTAKLDDTGNKKLFSVSIDNNGTVKTASYSDMNSSIEIFSAFLGRPTGISYKPSMQGYFNRPPELLTDNGIQGCYAYVMKVNACFGESAQNNLCFPENEGMTVKSIAFAKAEDYIL